jgi:predicted secreted protein
MKPNWSALSALLRALVVLAAATFVGALVLPLGVDGTLPMTWAGWRPVLATAFAATVVAEVAYARMHLAIVASALGLTSGPGATTTTTTTTAPAGTTMPSPAAIAAVQAKLDSVAIPPVPPGRQV